MMKGVFFLEKITQNTIPKLIELGVNAIFVGRRNLDELVIPELRKEGISIHLEVQVAYGEQIWQEFPYARPIDRSGNLMEHINWYTGACPNQPALRKSRLECIKTIVQELDIDGLWLDFIRYPCHWEKVRHTGDMTEYCFCPVCRKQFQQEIGGKLEGETWICWKCQQIVNFVKDTRHIIEENGKKIPLGMFSVPWRDDEFDGAMRKIIGQDLQQLANHIDIFGPMVYHKLTERSVEWIGETVQYVKQRTQKPVLPLIQTMNEPCKLTPEEFEKSLHIAMSPPSQGAVVFHIEDLLKNPAKMNIVREIFKDCQ